MSEKTNEYNLYPKSPKEAIEWWDSGRSVFSVEMGGLGPGYEQCIQILMIELLRWQIERGPFDLKYYQENREEWFIWGDEVVSRLGEYGFSGAQVGAAKSLAARFLIDNDWEKTVKSAPGNRTIQISKNFPGAGV